MFHNSLLDSIHLTADTYRKGINIKSSNSKFYIRLLKFSGIFATKTNLSGIGRFYKFRLKPRKKYFNKRF